MEHLETRIAHLEHLAEDLSEIIARQDLELTRLKSRIDMLLAREAEREAAGTGGVVLGDERPPHY